LTQPSPSITADALSPLLDLIQGIAQPQPQIVDIHGLAEVLDCSADTIQRTWRRYPHFFVTDGGDVRAVRFDVVDVLTFLKDRDYKKHDGSIREKNKELGSGFKDIGVSPEAKKRIRNSGGRKAVGAGKTAKTSRSGKSPDPIESFSREFGLS
jgi:hypothetical protein